MKLGLEPRYAFPQLSAVPVPRAFHVSTETGPGSCRMQLRQFDTRGARHTRFTMVSEEMQFLCLFFPVTAGLSVPSQSKVTLPGPRKRDDMGRKIEESCGCL